MHFWFFKLILSITIESVIVQTYSSHSSLYQLKGLKQLQLKSLLTPEAQMFINCTNIGFIMLTTFANPVLNQCDYKSGLINSVGFVRLVLLDEGNNTNSLIGSIPRNRFATHSRLPFPISAARYIEVCPCVCLNTCVCVCVLTSVLQNI